MGCCKSHVTSFNQSHCIIWLQKIEALKKTKRALLVAQTSQMNKLFSSKLTFEEFGDVTTLKFKVELMPFRSLNRLFIF